MNDAQTGEPEQLRLQRRLVELSEQRTRMSAERNYQNAERTLSVWVRTALALMAFGIAIDRFGLILDRLPNRAAGASHPEHLSGLFSIVLVLFGVIAAAASSIRFYLYSRDYTRHYPIPPWHQPMLASAFALLVAAFGAVLLCIMIFFVSV